MNSPITARHAKIGALVLALAMALTAAVAVAVRLGEPDGGSTAAEPASGPGAVRQDDGAGTKDEFGRSGDTGGALTDEAVDGRTAAAGFRALASARQEIIYTGSLSVRVDDVAASVREAERIASGAGGLVASSRVGAPPAPENGGFAKAELVVRVPTAQFDAVLDRLADLGKLLDRRRESQNVTEEVIDVETRVANQQRSIARIRDLLGKAVDLQDIVALESELSRREAELESLLARQAMLKDQTQLATISVSFHGENGAGVPDDDERGFLVGLRNGWAALVATAAVLLTGVGAALPFLIVLALLAAPAVYAFRRTRAARPAEGTPPPAAE